VAAGAAVSVGAGAAVWARADVATDKDRVRAATDARRRMRSSK
jgi:hypothetical protein